jgi:hypothetical protein
VEIILAAEFEWWIAPSLIGQLPAAYRPLSRRIQSMIPNWKNVLQADNDNEVVDADLQLTLAVAGTEQDRQGWRRLCVDIA